MAMTRSQTLLRFGLMVGIILGAWSYAFSAPRLIPRDVSLPESLGVHAQIYRHQYDGEAVKTLLLRLPERRRVLSTRQGFRDVLWVANHYAPRRLWERTHQQNIRHYETKVFCQLATRLDLSLADLAYLSTAADLEHLAVVSKNYGWLTVTALVTAGAGTNAQRAGVDTGDYIEWAPAAPLTPGGTINIILLTNAGLTEAALCRSLITLTEAKTAALLDLKIPSSYTPGVLATGTGTDNTIVVPGSGPVLNCATGHCKLGELIGRAVKEAVETALVRHIKAHVVAAPGRPLRPVPPAVLTNPVFRAYQPH